MQEDMPVVSVTFAEYAITTLEFDGFEFGGNLFQVHRAQRIEWLIVIQIQEGNSCTHLYIINGDYRSI